MVGTLEITARLAKFWTLACQIACNLIGGMLKKVELALFTVVRYCVTSSLERPPYTKFVVRKFSSDAISRMMYESFKNTW
jgi:hypothetical protein|tara:strand:- start:650 stop:889 length:240 start_codon:yes stop_codon:yes gene_type:complete